MGRWVARRAGCCALRAPGKARTLWGNTNLSCIAVSPRTQVASRWAVDRGKLQGGCQPCAVDRGTGVHRNRLYVLVEVRLHSPPNRIILHPQPCAVDRGKLQEIASPALWIEGREFTVKGILSSWRFGSVLPLCRSPAQRCGSWKASWGSQPCAVDRGVRAVFFQRKSSWSKSPSARHLAVMS